MKVVVVHVDEVRVSPNYGHETGLLFIPQVI
jgi:hypothetical protein